MKIQISLLCVALLSFQCAKKTFEPISEKTKSINANNFRSANGLLSPEDYYGFITQKSNVEAHFHVGTQNIASNLPYPTLYQSGHQANASIRDDINSENAREFGRVKIANRILPYTSYNQYWTMDYNFSSDLFGKVIHFEIPTPHKGLYVDSLYVPQRLFMTSPIRNEGNYTPPLDLSSGLALVWEADTRNYNGILIMVSYPPLPNEPTDYSVTPPYVYAQSVADNGRFTIPAEVFQKIPEGRRRGATVTLYRGAFRSIVDDENHATKISGHSSVVIDLSE